VKVLAVYSLKGGVGKTAAAVSLAHLAARDGTPTLVWDLDPQGAASYSFRVKPKLKGGAKALVTGKRELDDVIKGTDYESLDLVPADFSNRYMDLVLDAVRKPTRRIRRALREVGDEYEWVFLDCPPGISLISEVIIGVSDVLLVPVIPTTLSLRMLEQLGALTNGGADVTVLPFFSMVDRRKKLHREVVEHLPAERPEMLRTASPSSTHVEQMSLRREPVAMFARRSVATAAYTALWTEIKARIGGMPNDA
jgi:cellulose biosynthesis protein BcsQ